MRQRHAERSPERNAVESKGEVEARGGFLKSPREGSGELIHTQNEQCMALLTYFDFAPLRSTPLRCAQYDGQSIEDADLLLNCTILMLSRS